MRRRFEWSLVVTVAAVSVLAGGCEVNLEPGDFQRLRLVFELDRGFAAGRSHLVHTLFFPETVQVKRNLMQVSGSLAVGEGVTAPRQVKLVARVEDAASGRRSQKIGLTLNIGEDGSFSARKRIRKNLSAGQLMLVSLEPVDARLPAGARVIVCVDLSRVGEVAGLPPCAGADGGGGGSGSGEGLTLSSIETDILTPSCAFVGCHDSVSAQAGLVLTAGQSYENLVDVPSTQSPLDRVEPGDPEASYLVKKLRGDADITGSRMPLNPPFLSDSQLARVVGWIEAGAADD